MMTPHDRVRAAVTFGWPDRIPRDFWLLPWAQVHYPAELADIQARFPSDFSVPALPYRTSAIVQGDPYAAGSYIDDWGSQTALLIPPRTWRALFKPLYREYCELAHAYGKFTFMHSDGHITEIYPDLVEIGVDALNSQLACMDLQELARIAKGRMTFWGEIDRQHVLCADDPDVGKREVRRIATALHDLTGGIIAQLEFGAGARPATVAAVFEEWNFMDTGGPRS